LTEFYRERLKDSWEVHGSVLQGMIYLSQQPKYPGSAISRLLPTLNQELHVQTLSIENRKVCVKFFTEIFNRHEQWIVQERGSTFVMANSIISGENSRHKDFYDLAKDKK
jgi:hypothetical protein